MSEPRTYPDKLEVKPLDRPPVATVSPQNRSRVRALDLAAALTILAMRCRFPTGHNESGKRLCHGRGRIVMHSDAEKNRRIAR